MRRTFLGAASQIRAQATNRKAMNTVNGVV